MARNPSCTVYIGNLDERVTDRILYEILIQVGRVVDLHMPLDKETNRHKGYAFAEYESEEIAGYAIRLFSGLVRLYNKTLKFGMSGQDKPSQNTGTPVTPKTNPTPLPRPNGVHGREAEMLRGPAHSTDCRASIYASPATPITNSLPLPIPNSGHVREVEMLLGSAQSTDCKGSTYPSPTTPVSNLMPLPRTNLVRGKEVEMSWDLVQSTDLRVSTPVPVPYPLHVRETAVFPNSSQSINCGVSAYTHSLSPHYPQASARGFAHSGLGPGSVEYSRPVFGSLLPNGNRSDAQHPMFYRSYSNC